MNIKKSTLVSALCAPCSPKEELREAEIPYLLNALSSRIERLSEMQAKFRERLLPVLMTSIPAATCAEEMSASTQVGAAIALEISRVDCLIEDVRGMTEGVAV